ncbi:MAG: hypothetical protein M5U26_06160 [Planctomycetota bacterium]|nr:hypothetical protein [Planctomycetota bacterium]
MLAPAATEKQAWTVGREEGGARPALGPRPGDPEFQRAFPEDDGPAPLGRPLTGPAGKDARHPTRNDPEYPRRWPADEERFAAQPVPRGTAPEQAREDRPRFTLNQGLDDPRAQLDQALAAPLPPLLEAPAAPHAPGGSAEASPQPARAPDGSKPAPLETPGIERASSTDTLTLNEILKLKPKDQPAVRSGEEVDERFQNLLGLIRRNQDALKTRAPLKSAAEPAAENEDPDAYVETRDPKAVSALDFFLKDRPQGIVQGVVLDAETRQPLPARVRVVDASDLAQAAPLPDLGFWCNGSFRVPVAAGKVKIEVSAGRFRSSFLKGVDVEPGKVATVEAVLARPRAFDFAFKGWYLADLNLGLRAGRGERPLWLGARPVVADAVLAAYAEGVQVLGLAMPWDLGEETLPAPEILEFFQRLQGPRLTLLPVFRGPRHPFCGNVLGLGPATWEGLPDLLNDPRDCLRDWLEDIRQRGGVSAFADLAGRGTVNPREELLPLLPGLMRDGFYAPADATARLHAPAELPFDTIVGPAYDALAFDGSEAAARIWFNLLDEGYPVPVFGAGGGSLEGGRVPRGQTFVNVPGVPAPEKILEAVRRGHSVVSFGPAAFVKVFERDKGPGERLPADGRPLQLQIQAYASLDPGARLERIEIVRNGKVIHNEKVTEGLTLLNDFRFPFKEERNAWYLIRVVEVVGRGPETERYAWTNPIFFDTRNRELPRPTETRVQGVLRAPGGTPLRGAVTIVEPGRETREIPVGPDGRFEFKLATAGAMIFHAPGHAPALKRVYNEPRIQQALGALHTEREAGLEEALSRRSIFGQWRLLVAELNEDVVLTLAERLPEDAQVQGLESKEK